MPATQQLFFPDPKPLVERLGREFFRSLPDSPGVYLMRDAEEVILYVGKAKSLHKRLGSYRVANPDRMPRRHLRLLRSVWSIELRLCADEASALSYEAELLRTLKPRFNRAGTWAGPPRFFAWRFTEAELCMAVVEAASSGWRILGPLGRRAFALRSLLARLVWSAAHPSHGVTSMPAGWFEGSFEPEISIPCGSHAQSLASRMEKLFSGEPTDFCEWIRTQTPLDASPFDKASVEADLETLNEHPLRPSTARTTFNHPAAVPASTLR